MKKLIFNGCSFMAGDEIVWKDYCIQNNKPDLNWYDFLTHKTPTDTAFWDEYRYDYRMKRNLPSMVAKHLGTTHIDLSGDGYSNDIIALGTINYLLTLPPEERKNYHACIGWTTTARVMKYTYTAKCFYNLHINHIGHNKTDPILNELDEYLTVVIGKSYDEDIFLNFTKNIIMLENFLIANGMTYTFYKSLGTPKDTSPPADRNMILAPPFVKYAARETITNHDNWMRFDDEHLPYMGDSWTSVILKQNEHLFVSKQNEHPNIEAASELSKMINNKIILQNVGFN